MAERDDGETQASKLAVCEPQGETRHQQDRVPVAEFEPSVRLPNRTRIKGSGNIVVSNSPGTVVKVYHHPPDPTECIDVQAEDVAESCQKALKSHYKSTGSYVQMIPWIDDDKKHIMDIYTKLQLESESYSGKTLESYDDIFHVKTREGEDVNIAVLNGLAGRGKSTLFDKMVYDWAVGSSQALQRFQLVFLLKMHALEQGSDLVDAVFHQLLAKDTDVTKLALEAFVRQNPEDVLVLLDGFDEFMTTSLCPSAFGSVLRVLNRGVCRGCCVVVSTRPSHFHSLVTRQLVQEPFTYVRVLGFNENDISEYVKKFYSNKLETADELLTAVHSSSLLANLAKSPMLLLLMCLLWRQDSTLPDTMSRLYSQASKYIFKRKGDVSQDEIANAMIEIGKVGLRGLRSPRQVLSFKESDFSDSVLDTAIKAGILTRQRVLRGLESHNSVQFIHKTFQEFAAGSYLQSLFTSDRCEFEKIAKDVVPKGPDGLGYLLRFCCGDNEACSYRILEIFQESCEKYLSFDSRLGQLTLHCYFESQSSRLPPDDLIHSFIAADIIIRDLDIDCFNSITYFLKRVASQAKTSDNAFLGKVKKFHATQSALVRCGDDLSMAMSAMTNLYYVCLKDKWSKWGFSHSLILDGKAESWCIHLRRVKSLQRLNLSRCCLKGRDVGHITESLRDLPNLVELNISFNDLGGTTDAWCMPLRHVQCLKRLDLSRCSLSGQDVGRVAESLGNVPTLLELDLSDNALGGTAGSWCVHLKQLQRLRLLNLRHCSLIAQDVIHIAESLRDLPDLVELILSDNDLGGTAAQWCVHLKQLQQLQQLNLRQCSLVAADVEHVSESLPDLVALVLSDNDLGGMSGSLSVHLGELPRLRKLNLMFCNLSVEEKKRITDSLRELSANKGLIINF